MSFFKIRHCRLFVPLVYLTTNFVEECLVFLKFVRLCVGIEGLFGGWNVLLHSAYEYHQSNFLIIQFKFKSSTYSS